MRFHSDAAARRTKRSLRSSVEGRTIIGQHLTYPSGISIDFYTDRIFWADAKRSVIESSSEDGKNRFVVHDFGEEKPYKITIAQDWIFGTTFLTNKIFRIKKFAHLANMPKQDSFMVNKNHEIDKIRWIDAMPLSQPMLTVLNPIGTDDLDNYKKTVPKKCETCSDKQVCLSSLNTGYICLDECRCKPGFKCKKNGHSGDTICEKEKVTILPYYFLESGES